MDTVSFDTSFAYLVNTCMICNLRLCSLMIALYLGVKYCHFCSMAVVLCDFLFHLNNFDGLLCRPNFVTLQYEDYTLTSDEYYREDLFYETLCFVGNVWFHSVDNLQNK